MQGSRGFTETEVAIKKPAWVCTGASAYVMVAGLVFWGGFLTVEIEVSLTILPALMNPFSYWVFLLSLDIRLWSVLLFLAVPLWLMNLRDLIFFPGGDYGGVLGSGWAVSRSGGAGEN